MVAHALPVPPDEELADEELAPMEPGETRYSAEPRQTTLGDHGPQTIIEGRAFKFTPRDMAHRARVGREVEANPYLQSKPGRTRIHKLAIALQSFAGTNYEVSDFAAAVIAAGTLTRTDMVYMAHCRRAEEDKGLVDVKGGFKCPKCLTKIGGNTAVSILGVKLAVFDQPATATVRLHDGWEYGGKRIDVVELAPARLINFFDTATEAQLTVPDLLGMAIVAASIVGVGPADGPIQQLRTGMVQAADIERPSELLGHAMTERDFGLLFVAQAHVEGDVGLSAPWVHDNCGGTVLVRLGGWAQDFF